MKLSFALLPMAMAGTLTFGRHANLQAKIQTTAANQLSMTTTGCVDRSNWCAPYMSTDCATTASATVVNSAKFTKDGNSAAISLFSDGTLRFAPVGNTCVGYNLVAPSESEVALTTLAGLGQLNFNNANDVSVARIHLDATFKMTVQAAGILTNGVVVVPTTAAPTKVPTATPTTPSWLVGGTHAFTFHANTWCGPSDGMIATAAECQAAATSSSVAYQSQAGTTWHAGCIVHNNGAYFVPLTQGASHADATNGGYLCRAPKAAYHSTVWCAAVNGQITSEDQCKGAATKAGMNYVSQAGSEWHAGCIVHDGNVYFVADSGNSANHQQAVNNGYLCVLN